MAAGLSFVGGESPWPGLDATLPSHRGRGAQAALIARRVADAGVRSFVADLRAGFQLAWLRDNFTQTSSG
jgi:hypothetical protein